MIKVIVHSDHETRTYLFTQEQSIIIGPMGADGINIPLKEEGTAAPQVVISYQNGDYFALNVANDPFTTVNGEPFGRRCLRTGDRLEVGTTLMVCEITPLTSEAQTSQVLPLPLVPVSDDQLTEILAQAMATKSYAANPLGEELPAQIDLEHELQQLELLTGEAWLPASETWAAQDDAAGDDIDALVREVEALQWEEAKNLPQAAKQVETPLSDIARHPPSPYHAGGAAALPMQPAVTPVIPAEVDEEPVLASTSDLAFSPTHTTPTTPTQPISCPSSACADRDDQEEDAPLTSSSPPWLERLSLSWRWGVGILLIALLLLLLFASSFFVHLREKRNIEEHKAAQGIADIAMALTYAHFNQIRPQKQNWADPAFLRKNLGAVLASQYQILAYFDAQGQFTNTPYLLRIYTNHDLSQFLVIAQPAPSLTQWLVPKAAIVVDSRAMELRKMRDLRAINRLLVHAKTFDGAQTEEISQLVESGELIPLATLSNNSKRGFATPRALAIMQPAAANRIYNAPRYFLFGERILDKILAANGDMSSPGDHAILQQDLQALEQLPHLVLYSTSGIKRALDAQKALANFAPQYPFWVGYLKLGQEGQVMSGQLLPRSDPTTSHTPWRLSGNEELTVAEASPLEASSHEQVVPMPALVVEEQHPFAQQLLQLKRQRQDALAPLVEQMTALLQEQLHNYTATFDEQWQTLHEQLQAVEAAQNQNLRLQVHQLLASYSCEPMRALLLMIENAQLGYLTLDPLQVDFQQQHYRISCRIQHALDSIAQVRSLQQLATQVEIASELMRWEHFPHSQQLAKYQQQLFTTVVHKLSDFFLSPTAHLPPQDLRLPDRHLLAQILQAAWIQDPVIGDYYLSEFDYLASGSQGYAGPTHP